MVLKVDGAYLYKNGKPFFWLGDTAWLLFEKLSEKEIKFYLSERAKQGFNVVQSTILHTLSGVESRKTANAAYFDKIADAAEYARTIGVYLMLLPCWGDFVKKKVINEDNYARYAEFLGKRFKSSDNIIWALGGDIRGSVAPDIFGGFARILKSYNPERLITFHPFGRTCSCRWFNGCEWLDFNAFQSGHRRYGQKFGEDAALEGENDYEEDNYKYVKESLSLTPLKPCLDAEPSYEGIVQGLHDFTQPKWQARDIRRYAYWSVFSGACGFTYGHNAVMQMHREGDADANYAVSETWDKALYSEGAGEMKYLRNLMLSVDFDRGICRDELILNNSEKYNHTACFSGDNFLFAYNYDGKEVIIAPPFACSAYIMSPVNGKEEFLGEFDGKRPIIFPDERKSADTDRVIILRKI